MKSRTISVIGGSGNLGKALAWRWARSGHPVIIGSRTQEKAEHVAAELNNKLGKEVISGLDNSSAANKSDIIMLTVPFSAHQTTLEDIKPSLNGQIIIDATVPLSPPRVNVVNLPATGSVALRTQDIVGEQARVVSAFHNISANLLIKDVEIHCDILVSSDDAEAKQSVLNLCEDVGCRGIDVGALANSVAAEAMTSLLIHINKTYKVGHAGLQISGI
jgi:NADPH-dependent F420 reductase